MRVFLNKLSKHFDGFLKSMRLPFFFLFLLPFVSGHAYQFFAPASHFFEYWTPPMEIVSWNKVWETAIIQSNSNYYNAVHADWWDSMFCNWVKVATQPWEDYMSPKSPNVNWEFYTYTFRERDIQCEICWKIEVTTSRWYKKSQRYCSPIFDIER